MNYVALIPSAIAGVLVFAYIVKKRAERAATMRLLQQQQLGEIREFQELIGQVKANAVSKSESAKSLKEAYDAKYRSGTNNLVTPAINLPEGTRTDVTHADVPGTTTTKR